MKLNRRLVIELRQIKGIKEYFRDIAIVVWLCQKFKDCHADNIQRNKR